MMRDYDEPAFLMGGDAIRRTHEARGDSPAQMTAAINTTIGAWGKAFEEEELALAHKFIQSNEDYDGIKIGPRMNLQDLGIILGAGLIAYYVTVPNQTDFYNEQIARREPGLGGSYNNILICTQGQQQPDQLTPTFKYKFDFK